MPSRPVPSPSPSAFATLDRVAARTPDGRTLFDNLSLAFGRERTGLVGRNGVGKTTLLRLIAGEAEPAAGVVTRGGSLGVLAQTPDPAPGEAVADTLGVAVPLAAARRLLAGRGDAADAAVADWTLEERVAEALAGSGLAGLPLDRPTAALSGGERTRLHLARLRLEAPDLLLLDEPTNNLDVGARSAVRQLVETWPGGAVVVSHDRALLRAMDRIVELSSLGAAVHGGNWDLYVARRAAERAAAERALESAGREAARTAREAQRARERQARRDRAGRAFAARRSEPKILLGAMAERAQNTAARGQRLAARQSEAAEAARAAAAARVERVRELRAEMPSSGLAAGRTVLVLEAAGWTAPDGTPVLAPVSLRLTGPERIAVTGPNGAGKSTLLRLMSGDLEPTTGRIERPVPSARLDQHADLLRADETLLEGFLRLNPEATANAAHAAVARFLFRNAAALRPAGALSGGERLRAALACVLGGARPPPLLLLDEPTNHLDLDAIAAVEGALAAWDGALVVVSHDRDFLDAVGVAREMVLPGGRGSI